MTVHKFQLLVTKITLVGRGPVRNAGETGEVFDLDASEGVAAEREANQRFGHLLRSKKMNEWGDVAIGDTCLVILRNGKRHKFIEDRKAGCVMNGGEYQWCLYSA